MRFYLDSNAMDIIGSNQVRDIVAGQNDARTLQMRQLTRAPFARLRLKNVSQHEFSLSHSMQAEDGETRFSERSGRMSLGNTAYGNLPGNAANNLSNKPAKDDWQKQIKPTSVKQPGLSASLPQSCSSLTTFPTGTGSTS